MFISHLSVRRPVFATVVSALLVILGLASLRSLPVRQYPDVDAPVVSIETSYRGASAEVVETKVTQVIEDVIAGIEGIVKLTSTNRDERSDIRVEFALTRDIDAAANDIRDRVSRVVDQLPNEADPPEIAKVDSTTSPVMWLNLTSDRHTGLELTDYADRYLVDRFSTVPGVARVRISGARRYAMRIWLGREDLAARGLTVADVENNLRAENIVVLDNQFAFVDFQVGTFCDPVFDVACFVTQSVDVDTVADIERDLVRSWSDEVFSGDGPADERAPVAVDPSGSLHRGAVLGGAGGRAGRCPRRRRASRCHS